VNKKYHNSRDHADTVECVGIRSSSFDHSCNLDCVALFVGGGDCRVLVLRNFGPNHVRAPRQPGGGLHPPAHGFENLLRELAPSIICSALVVVHHEHWQIDDAASQQSAQAQVERVWIPIHHSFQD
jgi:hypothetical protein